MASMASGYWWAITGHGPYRRSFVMSQQIDAEGRPVTQVDVDQHPTRSDAGLRIFQILTALVGAALFAFGLVAVFRVDFGENLLDTTAAVGGFGFSAAAAIAAILLGGAALVATLADQDRGTAAFVGLLTLVVGIAGLVVEDQAVEGVDVDGRAAALFVGLGAAMFVLSLVPWFSRRRRTTTVVR